MLSFWIYCVFLLLFFSSSDSVPYPSNRCSENDCSYQLQDFMNDTCKIYNTSVCLDFFKFEESSEETLTSEEESKFHVSIVPYTAELVVKEVDTTVTRPAINITFTINNNDTDELVVKIYKKFSSDVSSKCRIFDFHNENNKKLPINLFYDCWWFNLSEDVMQNVRIDFIALPLKEKLSYYVFIPGTECAAGSCIWQPLIMVFRGELHNGVVQVKFSQAPELFNVSSYIIKLSNLSGDEKTIEIAPNISRRMLKTQFPSVDGGIYWISVKPVIWGVNASWTETDKFGVEILKSYQMLTVYLCIFILLTFSAFVFLKMFRRNIAKLRFGSKRRILLLYSRDCDEHIDFVIAFIQYLIKHCHVKVSTIYDELPIDWNTYEKPVNECNPKKWIKNKYNECDIIMYLISAGLFHTLDSKHRLPIKKYHQWRQQLNRATNFIESELDNYAEDIRKKKICKVCFSYSSKEYIPNRLRTGFGKCYDLPQEMKNLINFMHDSGECFLCNKLCITDFEPSFEGTDLSKKLRDVQAAVDSNSHIRIITHLKDTTNDSNSIEELENHDEISTASDSSDEQQFNNFMSESRPVSILIERSENQSLSGSPELENHDEISTASDSSDEQQFNNFMSESRPESIPIERSENESLSGEELSIVEPEGDSESEESDLLNHQPNLHNEIQVIENILNKNWKMFDH